MKNRNMKKIHIILVVLIIVLNCMTTVVSARFSLADVFNNARNFPHPNSEISVSELRNMQGVVYNLLFSVGVIIAVVGIAILGVQFITSSPEGKADIKEKMVPFTVGCIVVFGGLVIWRIAVNVIQSVAP